MCTAAVLSTRTRGTAPRWIAAARGLAAVIFLVFGVTKFASHAAELASFRGYPLPAPGFFVYLAGVVETGGGLLLALGLFTRLAALALAGDMIGAIAVSGLARGEIVSLTLAPLLLVAMIILIRSGGGSLSVDGWLAERLRRDAGRPAGRARAADDPRRPGPGRSDPAQPPAGQLADDDDQGRAGQP